MAGERRRRSPKYRVRVLVKKGVGTVITYRAAGVVFGESGEAVHVRRVEAVRVGGGRADFHRVGGWLTFP